MLVQQPTTCQRWLYQALLMSALIGACLCSVGCIPTHLNPGHSQSADRNVTQISPFGECDLCEMEDVCHLLGRAGIHRGASLPPAAAAAAWSRCAALWLPQPRHQLPAEGQLASPAARWCDEQGADSLQQAAGGAQGLCAGKPVLLWSSGGPFKSTGCTLDTVLVASCHASNVERACHNARYA